MYPFPYANSMRKTPQMQLNTSPTCFEGPRGREIWFRDPGPENRVQVLLNYVHHRYQFPSFGGCPPGVRKSENPTRKQLPGWGTTPAELSYILPVLLYIYLYIYIYIHIFCQPCAHQMHTLLRRVRDNLDHLAGARTCKVSSCTCH